jgi:hypothetical protein
MHDWTGRQLGNSVVDPDLSKRGARTLIAAWRVRVGSRTAFGAHYYCPWAGRKRWVAWIEEEDGQVHGWSESDSFWEQVDRRDEWVSDETRRMEAGA